MKKLAGFLLILLNFYTAQSSAAIEPEDYEMLSLALDQEITKASRLLDRAPGYDVVLRRDPMMSLVDRNGKVVYAPGLHAGLMVQGIIWADNYREVLVEDEFYPPGKKVGPYLILDIQRSGIVVQRDGEEKTLFVPLHPNV